MTYYSQRFHTSSLLACRDLPKRRYVVSISYLELKYKSLSVYTWQWVSRSWVVRARHEWRARLSAQAWLEFRSGIVIEPGSLRVASWLLDKTPAREGSAGE